MRTLIFLAFSFLLSFNITAQETIKTMFYNLLEFPQASPTGRDAILKNILDTYDPDIFMVCELQNQTGVDLILNQSLNSEGVEYQAAQFIPNVSGPAELQQLIFWKQDKFTLIDSEILITTVRDINHYTLQLNTTDSDVDPVIIEVYIAHLKSSQGTANQNIRLSMVEEFTTSLESLDPDAFVLFAGDFNVYRATEVAYEKILDINNNVVMVDPIDTPGSWNNNDEFQAVHTQSTRLSSAGFGAGAGGGMDDRFDFIMMSQTMQTNPKLRYIPNTYFPYGNNGNCYDNSVNSTDCTGTFSQELRDNIYNMSDHLPVVMNLETNKELLSTPENLATIGLEIENTLVKNTLNLKVPSYLFSSEIIIFNALGQQITSWDLTNQKNQTIDVTSIANGVYYLTSKQSSTQALKFVKTH